MPPRKFRNKYKDADRANTSKYYDDLLNLIRSIEPATKSDILKKSGKGPHQDFAFHYLLSSGQIELVDPDSGGKNMLYRTTKKESFSEMSLKEWLTFQTDVAKIVAFRANRDIDDLLQNTNFGSLMASLIDREGSVPPKSLYNKLSSSILTKLVNVENKSMKSALSIEDAISAVRVGIPIEEVVEITTTASVVSPLDTILGDTARPAYDFDLVADRLEKFLSEFNLHPEYVRRNPPSIVIGFIKDNDVDAFKAAIAVTASSLVPKIKDAIVDHGRVMSTDFYYFSIDSKLWPL